MKYKVGDKVRIKNLDWYNKNKDEDGDVPCGANTLFVASNKKYLGTIQTIERIFEYKGIYTNTYIYHMSKIDSVDWTDDMIEGLAEEEMSLDEAGQITDFEYEGLAYTLPDGYQFVDENGNVINATKIVLEKKKKEYPKTYEECLNILAFVRPEFTIDLLNEHYERLISSFYKLLICRDAYWKIAGEEMGLGEPWKPDWDNLSTNHEFIKINKGCFTYSSRVLVFPTAEMRDAFYENFKELINECKELL